MILFILIKIKNKNQIHEAKKFKYINFAKYKNFFSKSRRKILITIYFIDRYKI